MPPSVVQCDYQQMESVAKRFQVQAEQTEQLLQQVRDRAERLCDGNWIGRAGEAFQDEMERLVFPALQRMIAALQEASSVTTQISETMRQAEEEAAGLFGVQAEGSQEYKSQNSTSSQDKSWWDTWGEWVHGTLDVIGFIPVYGEAADGVNALIYLVEGRYVEAGISAAAMLPIIGDAGKLGRLGAKAGKELLEEAAEAGAERAAKEIAEQTTERSAKELGENVGEKVSKEGAEDIAGKSVTPPPPANVGSLVASQGRQVRGKFPDTGQPNEILYRADPSGKITHYQVYDSQGLPIMRVDITGKAHGGVPTPHVLEFQRNVGKDGKIFVKPNKEVRQARPDELP